MEKFVEDDGWKARLVDEHKKLVERINKLDTWMSKQLETTEPEEIPGYRLMCIQLCAMQAYASALEERMSLYEIEYEAS